MLVFAYGTLMDGQLNHRQLEGARLEAAARSVADFTLFDAGPWPAMVRGGSTAVSGELYAMSELQIDTLDAFEGHPALFCRESIELVDGRRAETWIYVAKSSPAWIVIGSGDWRKRQSGDSVAVENLPGIGSL
jgi:gamma-glutamylaminecyclotransferase